MKVLLLEDDTILHEIILEYLQQLACETVSVYDGEEALDLVLNEKFDLMLLDVNVPGMDGFTFLQSLRDISDRTPAIFITSLNSGTDVEKGFAVGADDYLKKPFDLIKLKARIDNIKRRFQIDDRQLHTIDEHSTYDFATKTISSHKRQHHLSQKEAAVLEYFLKHPARVISFEELLNNVWSYEDAPTYATLRTYIKNLRALLPEGAIQYQRGRLSISLKRKNGRSFGSSRSIWAHSSCFLLSSPTSSIASPISTIRKRRTTRCSVTPTTSPPKSSSPT